MDRGKDCIFGDKHTKLPAQILPTTTAGVTPERFSEALFFLDNRWIAAIILTVFIAIGFGLRINDLGSESFGEDELNKLETVNEYRTNGLSGKNGEHPFLMKGLQTVSVVLAEKINESIDVVEQKISPEAAIRLPIILFGTFIPLLIFLLVSELFGRSVGLVAAIFWAVEPMAIGFDRIAKEDSLVLFFFLLASFFWVRSQTMAERDDPTWIWYALGTGAGFAGLMASKYYPHLLTIFAGYYIIFQYIPATKWRMESVRWLKFFAVMGVTFLILNPTIMLPDTWREMVKFSSENRIGHDSYEFIGTLYTNKLTAWLGGVPWTFYFVFLAVKTSLATLLLFAVGLPLMFRRKLGDGRFFIFFWAFVWLLSFTFLGGKFTRYFTLAEPLIFIVAAVGFCFLAARIAKFIAGSRRSIGFVQLLLLGVILAFPTYNAVSSAPHFRMFTNLIGGGQNAAGSYFPHDEFYDASTRQIMAVLATEAKPEAIVACETPALFEHYAGKVGREDLIFVSLSDRSKVAALRVSDFIVLAKGRRYLSNTEYTEYLGKSAFPLNDVNIWGIESAKIYELDRWSLRGIQAIAGR